jgi:hypothetical protein
MNEKFDLARMLREINAEKQNDSSRSRSLTQEEIRLMVAARKTLADTARAKNSEKAP